MIDSVTQVYDILDQRRNTETPSSSHHLSSPFHILFFNQLSVAVAVVVDHITPLIFFIMSFLPSNRFLSAIGLVLSVYAVYVEHKVEHLDPDEEFTALCDIQALNASCRYVHYSIVHG
jgi:hypothetical protein